MSTGGSAMFRFILLSNGLAFSVFSGINVAHKLLLVHVI